ncbi:MAG: FAD-dependent monooxygenase [Firmicutes bacterium]|nr:FAD-dependent monooxygenase [Bacillota bacterium]
MSEKEASIPVAIVGAGPVGLAAGLELQRFGVPFRIFEEDTALSNKPKAGTILPRSLEIFAGEGVIDGVLREGLRFDEVHFIDRPSDKVLTRMLMSPMADETRYPFIVNLPQSDLEAQLAAGLTRQGHEVAFGHKLVSVTQDAAGCHLVLESPQGTVKVEAQFVLACDGGRSLIRHQLGIEMEGVTHPERFLVADFEVDLDRRTGRQLTYLSYIFDPEEWVIFVRQPRFWRFLIPVAEGAPEPTQDEVVEKVRRVVKNASLPINFLDMGIYHVHHRAANKWQDGRIFLLGDAAHLITPVGGLGMNTGIQDAHNVAWKIAWVLKYGATEALLTSYEQERAPIARLNARNQAERNREIMRMKSPIKRMVRNAILGWMDRAEGLQWQAAHARSLLGTSYKPAPKPPSLWSQLRTARHFQRPAVGIGERVPDGELLGSDGQSCYLHDLLHRGFVALILIDPRTRVSIDPDPPGLTQYLLHRFDAAFDTGLRDRALLDKGGRMTRKLGVPSHYFILLRPDGHVAAISPFQAASSAVDAYRQYIGHNAPRANANRAAL